MLLPVVLDWAGQQAIQAILGHGTGDVAAAAFDAPLHLLLSVSQSVRGVK